MSRKQIYQGDEQERRRQAVKAWRERNPDKSSQAVKRCHWKAARRRGVKPKTEVGHALELLRTEAEIRKLQQGITRDEGIRARAAHRVLALQKELQDAAQKLQGLKGELG